MDLHTIVFPSTLELTGRLEFAARYTSFAPKPLRTVRAREEEVISLLQDWQKEESEDGCEIREPLISGGICERRIKLNGRRLGKVVTSVSHIPKYRRALRSVCLTRCGETV
jgi:hypothetical protein